VTVTRAGAPTWKLNSFLDSLILELDRAQDTLAVKGLNRRLTYTVRDLSLELQLFPDFDGRELRFATAKPGETGAAKIAFQLGSITDRQIRETTKDPITQDDVSIETVEGLDDETKADLQKIGVTSVKDIERMQHNNIDLERMSGRKVDYSRLANVINRAKRRATPPAISAASLAMSGDTPTLVIEGENLVLADAVRGEFPLAYLNDAPLEILAASPRELRLAVPEHRVREGSNELRVLLDPHAVMTVDLQS
jgi:hypothetical protein